WNGQTEGDYPFSVAQHSVLVLELFRTSHPEAAATEQLHALLHDAPEYVMGDIISPFKAAMGGNYRDVEGRLLSAVHLRFSLPAQAPASLQRRIKAADRAAAYFEAVRLAGFTEAEAKRYFGNPVIPAFDVDRFDELIRPWPTHRAYDRFLAQVEALLA